ncbi:hypothetical protein OG735_24050 [Streptomyces sp. NBC_01210]|uniref:aminoacyl--tRNA ligase-related protein n=1 Tax=Streptomyces sp. NBC_01210 TaxID=2903774 RepID=UPI002E0D7481|nr:hypothetical protein OG735_24050 [Streptomyces sp. NBC_01210]
MIPAQALDDFKLSQFKPGLLWRVDGGEQVLDPVQCLPFYHSLRDSSIDVTDLPLKVVETLGGWTWRKEREEELDGVFRAKEFLRFEHVWLGTPEATTQIREEVLGSVTSLLLELGLSTQTVVGEGCMPIPEVTQRTLDAKVPSEVPVIDIELRVREAKSPGELTAADFDEIAGCTIEGSHHLESFGITSTTGEEIWSGCCGVGLNRLVIGFLFQHGFDPKKWPAVITEGNAIV